MLTRIDQKEAIQDTCVLPPDNKRDILLTRLRVERDTHGAIEE